MLRTKFNKFEDIALKVNEIANIPKIKTLDFKIDNQKLKGYQFYFRATTLNTIHMIDSVSAMID